MLRWSCHLADDLVWLFGRAGKDCCKVFPGFTHVTLAVLFLSSSFPGSLFHREVPQTLNSLQFMIAATLIKVAAIHTLSFLKCKKYI